MAEGRGDRRRADLATRLGPFRHPAYAIYWTGGLVSNMGTWLQTVAGSVFVYQLTRSTFAVGVFNFAGFIPILLFSVWGGALSDRYDRRSVVMVTHVVSGLVAGVLAVRTVAGSAGVVDVVATAFVINLLWALGKPSLVSLIPNIVPRTDLQDAVGLNSLQFIAGQIIGPTIAAITLATAGAGMAFSINALTYLGPIGAMLYLQRRDLGGRARRRSDASDGSAPSIGSFVRGNAWVPAMLVAVVTTAAAMEIQRTLAPGLVHEILGEPEASAGLLVAAQSVGSAIALLLFVPIRRRGWSRTAATGGFLSQGLGILIVAGASSLLVAGIGVSFIGFGFSLSFPVLTATLQEATPDRLRGRVMAFHQLAHLGNRPFTALIIGGAAAAVSIQAGVLVGLVLVPVGIAVTRIGWRALPLSALEAARAADATGPRGDGPGSPPPAVDATAG
jgi:MFS family permease